MIDEPNNIIQFPTSYQDDETVPRSEVEELRQNLLTLVDEVALLTKSTHALIRYLRKPY